MQAGQVTADQLTTGYASAVSGATAVSASSAATVNALLAQTFLAALPRGEPATNYLILWLDPVNFNFVDPQGRQMGFTQEGGQVQENSAAFFARANNTALQLLIVPGVSLEDSFQLDLVGVGAGPVLVGAELVQADGVPVAGQFQLEAGAATVSMSPGGLDATLIPKSIDGQVTAILDFQQGSDTVANTSIDSSTSSSTVSSSGTPAQGQQNGTGLFGAAFGAVLVDLGSPAATSGPASGGLGRGDRRFGRAGGRDRAGHHDRHRDPGPGGEVERPGQR